MEVLVSPSIYSDSVFVFVVVVAGEEEEEEEEEFSSFDFCECWPRQDVFARRIPLCFHLLLLFLLFLSFAESVFYVRESSLSSSPSPSLQSFVLVRRKRASIFDEDDDIADFLLDLSPAFGPTTERKLSHNARKKFPIHSMCAPQSKHDYSLYRAPATRAINERVSGNERVSARALSLPLPLPLPLLSLSLSLSLFLFSPLGAHTFLSPSESEKKLFKIASQKKKRIIILCVFLRFVLFCVPFSFVLDNFFPLNFLSFIFLSFFLFFSSHSFLFTRTALSTIIIRREYTHTHTRAHTRTQKEGERERGGEGGEDNNMVVGIEPSSSFDAMSVIGRVMLFSGYSFLGFAMRIFGVVFKKTV